MLLFDQNLSPETRDCFPGAIHVQDVELTEASDSAIWSFAVARKLAIVTKDGDFRQRSFLEGYPPRIIWVATGDC
jgi:predicted nuclease of predicted toxin-antitoxin system